MSYLLSIEFNQAIHTLLLYRRYRDSNTKLQNVALPKLFVIM